MSAKTALITGGATGIGKRTAEELAKQGIHVILNYRNSGSEAEQLVEALTERYGTKNYLIRGDVAKTEDCLKLCHEINKLDTSVDILIHNAGPYIHERKKMSEYTLDEWNYLMNGNLNAVFLITRELLPQMRQQQWGRIITIGFDRVETSPGWIYRSAFAAAKTGLASLTRSLALEEADFGITANMVCPGDIIGEWKEAELANLPPNIAALVNRRGTGEDISRVISFLVDERSSFITGSIIPVTGGVDVLGKIHK